MAAQGTVAPPGKTPFRLLAERTSEVVGSSAAFVICVVVVVVWALSGFFFGFSDAWQLIINTLTNVATLFIVFLIQNTQNRQAKAMHLKLDELIRAVQDARTHLVGLENLSDEELKRLERQFQRIHAAEMRKLEQNGTGATTGATPPRP